jgi:hypothetical protein
VGVRSAVGRRRERREKERKKRGRVVLKRQLV